MSWVRALVEDSSLLLFGLLGAAAGFGAVVAVVLMGAVVTIVLHW